jgi:TusA-related sulfurtransferase
MSELLDVKGLNCPLPVPKGEVLTVEATDPNAARDIPALCEASGFELMSLEERDGVFVFQIRQAA